MESVQHSYSTDDMGLQDASMPHRAQRLLSGLDEVSLWKILHVRPKMARFRDDSKAGREGHL